MTSKPPGDAARGWIATTSLPADIEKRAGDLANRFWRLHPRELDQMGYIPGSDILGAREAFYRDQIATALVEERRRTEVAEAERDTARQELAALRTSAEATLADTHAATEQSPASPSDSESALQSVQEALLRYDVEMREYHRQCWCEDWSRGTIHVPAYYQAQNARRALEGAIKRWTDRHEAEFEAQAEHEMEAMDATAGDTAAANDQSDQGNTPARPS